jgi:hypothetical protein
MGGTTPCKLRSAAVGRRHSSRIELTSLSSVARWDLGGFDPARLNAAVSNKVRAESIHARFVVLVTLFEDEVDFFSRSCLDT